MKIHTPRRVLPVFLAIVLKSVFLAGAIDSPANHAITESHQTFSLNGAWMVTSLSLETKDEAGYRRFETAEAERLAAQVPGEIHLDLMRAGRMEDPDVSDNARTKCRWPEEHSWWYRKEFTLPPGFRDKLQQTLIFDGIDYSGQVFLNGKMVGTTRDSFAIYEFDVKRLLQDGPNELVVRVTSGTELLPVDGRGSGFSGIYATRSFDQRRLIRKPAYSYGWDWCDPLPNIGLWRGVRLEARTKVALRDVRLDTVIHNREAALEGEITLENLHPWSEFSCEVEVRIDPPQGTPIVKTIEVDAVPGRSVVPCRVVIPQARLWWPNGMGDQPIYRLTTRVLCGTEETDRQTQRVGLRTIEVDRSRLPDGTRFCFKVNGRELFCKGGNWAPADLIPARMDSARYEKLIAEARNAHFTMFRVNGVGLYESEAFYEACDRAGILVWQDFTFSCFQYADDTADFINMVRHEAESVVRTLRHHPSLALWSGNNECLMGMSDWWGCNASKPEEIGGVRIYNQVLPDVCRFYDPKRLYWPGSPAGGENPNAETSGDCHWWYTFGNSPDVIRRVRHEVVDECRARFVSEYGIMGPPNMASVRQFLKPSEISRDSTAWKIHQNSMERGIVDIGIKHHYGDPQNLSLSDFLLYGQMAQAVTQGGAMESMRFRKHDAKADCEGALVWSYNDCWGETGWSIIDHYARRKASYYWFRRACAPVKVLVRAPDGRMITRVANDTLKEYAGTVRYGWMRLDGTAQELREKRVAIPADGMVEVANIAVPSRSERNPREWMYAAYLTGKDIPDDQAVWLLAPQRELALAKPSITVRVQGRTIEVSSPVYCHAVHLEDDGEELLEDNYFDLLPGVTRRVSITKPTASGNYPLTAILPIGRVTETR
jgi:beta-mannosidase